MYSFVLHASPSSFMTVLPRLIRVALGKQSLISCRQDMSSEDHLSDELGGAVVAARRSLLTVAN